MSVNPSTHTIRFWNVAGGREQARVPLPEDIVGAVISPDGRTVAAWCWRNEERDRGLRFLDAASGKPAKGWIAPNLKEVFAVRFTPDGKTVLVGTKAGVLVWDPIAGKLLRTLSGGVGHNPTLSPDGKTVASLGPAAPGGPYGSVLHVWDLATGAPRVANTPEHGHLGEVDNVAFAPDSRTVASVCYADRSVRLWEAATGRLLRSLPADKPSFRALAFSPDGKHLFVGTSPAILRWEVATRREVHPYSLFEAGKEDRQHLLRMHLTDDGRTLLAVTQNLDSRGLRGLHAWDVATGKRLRSGSLADDKFRSSDIRFSPDGRVFAWPGGSVHDAATGEELFHVSVEGKLLNRPIAFSRDGALLAAGVWQKIVHPFLQGQEMVAVQVWELATLLPVARLQTGALADFSFTPDGRRLVTAGPDALKLWDLASGREVARRTAPGRFRGSFGSSFASSFALAADGHTVATGQPDTTVLLWDLRPPAARPAAPLSAAQRDACWADLASDDAGRALAALARLADVPEQAVALLGERLRPVKAPPAEELRRLLAGLDDPEFDRREAATKRLVELGELAEPALREALRGGPSAEVRRRIEDLLAGPRLVKAPEARRGLRAVRLLESIGTAEAQRVLRDLAKGMPEARLTREAKAALERLARGGTGPHY